MTEYSRRITKKTKNFRLDVKVYERGGYLGGKDKAVMDIAVSVDCINGLMDTDLSRLRSEGVMCKRGEQAKVCRAMLPVIIKQAISESRTEYLRLTESLPRIKPPA